MKKKSIILLLSLFSVLGAYSQGSVSNSQGSGSNSGQNYINQAKAALNRKDYDESMRWAQRYVNEYNSYSGVADIAEQMFQDARAIYPNDKKGFVKPMQYAGSLGHSQALLLLGAQYYAGTYIPKDIEKGMALIKASERLGNQQAASYYRTLANGAEWISYNAKKQGYNDMVLGAVGLTALVAVVGKLIGNLPAPSSSYSSSSYRSSSSSSSYSSSSSSSSSSKPANSSADPETVSIPSYEFDSQWYIGSHDYYNVKNEVGENQYRDLKFSDGTKGKVCRVVQSGNKYWYWSDNARYESLEAAINAVYVKQKYGKTRDKGRVTGIFY